MSGEFAGTLRERVVIETRLGNRDSRAGAVGNYRYDGQAWAAVSPLMPADLTRGDALSALPRWRVTLRKREGVGIGTRLTWRGKYLAVRAALSDPQTPAQMHLTCEEVR
ncbi:MAG: head-tail adaptor protein [Sphingomonadaceae bacterium]|nr:head-tail adaptor protein [Sphingomonadaceae bacterium]MBJ7388396.1 head-tail adaptor protein [Sphingomonadaceae bacterium]